MLKLSKRQFRRYGKLSKETEKKLSNIYLTTTNFRISCKVHKRLCENWGIDYNSVRNDRKGVLV